jgi:hypothetical protein
MRLRKMIGDGEISTATTCGSFDPALDNGALCFH